MKKFKIGIVGFGLIGKKRFNNLGSRGELVAYSDLKEAKNYFKSNLRDKVKFFKSWKSLVNFNKIDIVIISTYHNDLSKIVTYASIKGKHILVEKPAGIKLKEIENNIKIQKKYENKIRVGFNHRYHGAIKKCQEIIKKKSLGKLMFIKSSYGHGARLNYQNEWRMNPKISGGGELIDQGSHLIDLSIMFLGKIKSIKSVLDTLFWKTKVDDNAFLIFKFENNTIAFLHASCTEWKNNFLFEIYGEKGKLRIEGKGGSYGREKLIFYKMKKKMGMPSKKVWLFPKTDYSWKWEIEELYKDIKLNRDPKPGLKEAYEVLKIIKKVYKSNQYDNCT